MRDAHLFIAVKLAGELAHGKVRRLQRLLHDPQLCQARLHQGPIVYGWLAEHHVNALERLPFPIKLIEEVVKVSPVHDLDGIDLRHT